MMIGAVDANLEAHLPFFVEGATGQPHAVDAVVDTGFTGFLCLAPAQIAALGLPWVCQIRALLADGSVQMIDVYLAAVIWDNHLRMIRVNAMNSSALVGMKLLEGSQVRLKVTPGGSVEIDPLP
jgi:clan AA aspartic protease